MELISSDEEECETVYWNNWLPSNSEQYYDIKRGDGGRSNKKRSIGYNFPGVVSVTSTPENFKFGTWIPPVNFLNRTLKEESSTTSKANEMQFCRNKKIYGVITSDSGKMIKEVSKEKERNLNSSCIIDCRKKINLDWGERVELHDITKFSGGDLIWGVVDLGIFETIKLWVNEYRNICCFANGKVSKLNSSELTFISITDTQLLRKMLNVSSMQWASLCETLLETKTGLNFDAFQNYDITRLSALEKLWFFICKRRHFLPKQCMLVKYSGAVKCLRKFNITPKLLVKDIRSILGEPIL